MTAAVISLAFIASVAATVVAYVVYYAGYLTGYKDGLRYSGEQLKDYHEHTMRGLRSLRKDAEK